MHFTDLLIHSHTLEKEMATHSSILVWRIPGMGEPGGLQSIESHRVRHNWSDLAAAAAAIHFLKRIGAIGTILHWYNETLNLNLISFTSFFHNCPWFCNTTINLVTLYVPFSIMQNILAIVSTLYLFFPPFP